MGFINRHSNVPTFIYTDCTEKVEHRLEGNISLEEINLPRPEVIITFNLL